MTPTQIAILVAVALAFIVIGALAWSQVMRIPWPAGPRELRVSALGNEIVVIDAPGVNDAAQTALLDACVRASVAIFTAWHVWRPNDADTVQVFPLIGVHFIDDALMNDVQHALFNGVPTASYLSEIASRFKRVPLLVIRKSLAAELIVTGQPFMHEMLHALLNYFLPDEQGIHDHTHVAWGLVQGAANSTYVDLYAPRVA